MPPETHPDALFAALAAAQDGLSAEQSLALMSRLVLLLARRVDAATMLDALAEAGPAQGSGML